MPTGDRRVCLLTGAAGVLGSEFCRRYAGEYDIVAVCRTRAPVVPSQLETYVDPLDPADQEAASVYTVFADLREQAAVDRLVEVALARFGRVDLLVNAAAYTKPYSQTMVDGDAALINLDEHLRTNVVAPMRLATTLAHQFWMHRAADNLADNRNIVNISATAGSTVYPFQGQAGYAASKAALNALTGHMAAEFRSFGVRVNTVVPNAFPGAISTGRVTDAIIQFDRGKATGSAIVLDK